MLKIIQSMIDAVFLPLTGGTLTGFLTLSAAPTTDLHASTKKYVDDSVAAVSGPVPCYVHKNSVNQGIAGASFIKVTFSNAELSGAALFDDANDRITATEAGEYDVKAQITYTGSITAGDLCLARILKNGSNIFRGNAYAVTTGDTTVTITGTVALGIGDYIELQAYKGGAATSIYGAPSETFLIVTKL